MKSLINIILILIIIILSISTSHIYSYKIEVVDKLTLEPIPNAIVWDVLKGKKYTTDKKGKIEISDDIKRIIVDHKGYTKIDKTISGDIKVLLKPIDTDYVLDKVVVELGEEKVNEGTKQRVTGDYINKQTTFLFSDAIQTLKTMPGVVQAGGSFSALMYVRGGNFYETISVLDNLYLLNPYHWGGRLSVFNPKVVDTIDFYSGGFPARYGQAMSGIIDVKTKYPSAEKIKGDIILDAATFEALLEGPVLENTTSWISLRRTHYDLVMNQVSDQEGIEMPFFYDAHSKWMTKVNDNLTWFNTFMGSYEGMDMEIPAEETGTGGNFKYRDKAYRFGSEAEYKKGDFDLHSVFGIYYHAGDYYYKEGSNYFDVDIFNYHYQLNNLFKVTSFKDHTIEFGSELNLLTQSGEIKTFFQALPTYLPPDTDIYQRYYESSAKSDWKNELFWHLGLFAQDDYEIISDKLFVNYSIRTDYMNIFNKFTVDPRLGLKYFVIKDGKLKLNVGLFSQFPINDGQMLDEEHGNRNLGSEKSVHYVLGYEQKFLKDYLFRVEGFYKNYFSLVNSDVDTTINYQNGSEGIAYGFDLFLQKKISDNLNGWISYTYAVSKRKIMERTTVEEWKQKSGQDVPDYGINLFQEYYFPTYDRRHNLSAIMNWEFIENWELSSKIEFSTGAPYTPLSGKIHYYDSKGTPSTEDDEHLYAGEWGDYNSERLPNYFNFDLKLSMPFFNITGMRAYIQFMNLFNYKNVNGYTYDANMDRIEQKDLPFLFIGGFRYTF